MLKRILLIEDDPHFMDLMTFVLEEAGFQIIKATTGGSLRQAQELRPALIFMDNQLKDGFGYHFCHAFKSNPITAHFPLVLLSGNSDLEQIALENGADAFLEKPFEISELIDLVDRFCAYRT
jgi:two-component system, OmpR family, phosphate regulon response regulator PhoB